MRIMNSYKNIASAMNIRPMPYLSNAERGKYIVARNNYSESNNNNNKAHSHVHPIKSNNNALLISLLGDFSNIRAHKKK